MCAVVHDPKYRSIARILEEELRGFNDGQRVPSENEVAKRFGVARSTARAALQYLTARNVIRGVRGAGSFASRRIDYPIDAQRAPSWSATVHAAGADQLDAPQSSLGWYIESLNVDESTLQPVSITQRWLRDDTVRVTFDSAVSS